MKDQVTEYISIFQSTSNALGDGRQGSQFVVDFLGFKNQKLSWLSSVKFMGTYVDNTDTIPFVIHRETAFRVSIFNGKKSDPSAVNPFPLSRNAVTLISIDPAVDPVLLNSAIVVDNLNKYEFREGDFLIKDSLFISWETLFPFGFVLPASYSIEFNALLEIRTPKPELGRDPF